MFRIAHLAMAAIAPISLATCLITRSCLKDTKPLAAAAPSIGTPQVADAVLATEQAELDQASLAQERATTLEVRGFAGGVVMQATNAQSRIRSLASAERIAPLSSDLGEQLRHDSNANHAALMLDEGLSFDRDYLAKEIKGCEDTLGRLDLVLLPHVRNDALRERLNQVMRDEFQARLIEARNLQQ